MLIEDLPYFESASEDGLISGAAGTSVLAVALALGNPIATFTNTNSTARLLPRGGSLSISRGFGLAIGDTTFAQVTTSGSGEIVVGSNYSTPNNGSGHVSAAFGIVIAIDLPSTH
jgi:hypothetical protein